MSESTSLTSIKNNFAQIRNVYNKECENWSIKNDEKEKMEKELPVLDEKIKKLKETEESLNERIASLFSPKYDKSKIEELKEKRKALKADKMVKIYEDCVKKLLEVIKRDYLMPRLKVEVTQSKVVQDVTDQRGNYKIYGLLLHACRIKDQKKIKSSEKHTTEIIEESLKKLKLNDQQDAKIHFEEYVNDTFLLTHSMLTLLPPLMICSTAAEFKGHRDDLFEKSRATWKDGAEKTDPLRQYRPALVFGNQLHVSVPGLVGNSLAVVCGDDTAGSNPGSARNTPSMSKRDLKSDACENPESAKNTPSMKKKDLKPEVCESPDTPFMNTKDLKSDVCPKSPESARNTLSQNKRGLKLDVCENQVEEPPQKQTKNIPDEADNKTLPNEASPSVRKRAEMWEKKKET